MISCVFLDLDDTILDFRQAERTALGRTLAELGISSTPDLAEQYSRINAACWKQLERGELTRRQVKTIRFARLFSQFGLDADPEAASERYMHYLGQGHWFLPGAEEAVARLSKKYRLFLASNGTASIQKSRMTSADLYRYFEQCFVSEEMGASKPSPVFFRTAFARIPDFDPARAIIAGDSLTADIRGGIQAGIRTCWVNTRQLPPNPEIRPDYEIPSLDRLEGLLETL